MKGLSLLQGLSGRPLEPASGSSSGSWIEIVGVRARLPCLEPTSSPAAQELRAYTDRKERAIAYTVSLLERRKQKERKGWELLISFFYSHFETV